MTVIQYWVIRFLVSIGLVYIPEFDEVVDPYLELEPEPEKPKTLRPREPTVVPNTSQIGESEFGRKNEQVHWLAPEVNDLEWNFQQWDGKEGTPDFTAWSYYDDFVIQRRKYHEKSGRKADNYRMVRPEVLAGASNRDIELKFSKSDRWAEEYGGAVREMIRLRMAALSESKNEAGHHSPSTENVSATENRPKNPHDRGVETEDQQVVEL